MPPHLCRRCGVLTANYPLCNTCSTDYFVCDDCDCVIGQDEYGENGRCEACLEEQDNENAEGNLNSNDYCPNPIFLPYYEKGALYFGVELETDHYPNGRRTVTKALNNISQGEDLFWLGEDGSLDNGIEIISHPATLEYHLNEFPWKRIMNICKDYEGKSHDTTTCGLHVHFNTNYLGEPESDKWCKNIKRFLALFYTHKANFAILSRRTSDREWTWAQPLVGQPANYTYGRVKDIKRWGDKYRSVNICPDQTIEVRIFKGTLVLLTLFATLEFMDWVIHHALRTSLRTIRTETWKNFALPRGRYQYLPNYIIERGLYVPNNRKAQRRRIATTSIA